MPDPIYCYYHRHARLEIIQRHGQTYALCPECRQVLAKALGPETYRANCGEHYGSDDLIHRLFNKAPWTRRPVPAIYMFIDTNDAQL